MPRDKEFHKGSNIDPLLQHIRSVLRGNYVFYQECVVAITCAAERHQDASAWFEQLEQVVVGVEEVAFSHAGVVFLLQEMVKGGSPSTIEKLPLPLPHHLKKAMERPRKPMLSPRRTRSSFKIPSPPSSSKAPSPRSSSKAPSPPSSSKVPSPRSSLKIPSYPSFLQEEAPATQITSRRTTKNAPTQLKGMKNTLLDPIFFADPRFKFEVNDYWGNPAGSNRFDFTGSSASGYNINASYNTPNDFIPRYKPIDNDMQVYKQDSERAAKEKNKETSDIAESEWHCAKRDFDSLFLS